MLSEWKQSSIRRWCLTVALVLMTIFSFARVSRASEVEQLLGRFDQLWFGQRSKATVSMTVKTANYQRILRLVYWVDGGERTSIRIIDPAREKGTTTLKIGDDIFNYLPKIGRVIKVSSALRSGSWMGSHFSNDDLVRGTRLSDAYSSRLVDKKTDNDGERWLIELIPKGNALVFWSKVILTLRNPSALPVKQEFYDEKGMVSRTVTYDEIRELGGKKVPCLIRVTPSHDSSEYTELRFESIDRDVTFPPNFFSVSRLRNW